MKDFALVYQRLFKEIKDHIKGLPVLVLAFILYLTLTNLMNNLFTQMGNSILSGFIRWFIQLAILTHLAGLLTRLFRRGSLSMEDLAEYDQGYLAPLSQVYFVFYLVEMLAASLGRPILASTVYLILFLVWSVFISPAYEEVYQSGETMNTIFPSLLHFWKENILILIPYVLVAILIYRGLGMGWSIMASIPGTESFIFIVGYALLKAVFYYTKGLLFMILSRTSKRSRAYHERSRY